MEPDSRWILRELVAAAPAHGGATATGLGGDAHDFARHWIDVLAGADRELAAALAGRLAEALALMDRRGVVEWIDAALAAFDHRGLGAALAVLETPKTFARERAARARGLTFEEVAGVLRRYLAGLGGRSLALATSTEPWTDTETVFLPPLVGAARGRGTAFALYKAMAVHLWAQVCFGTWRVPVLAGLRRFEDRAWALEVYAALERERLEACLVRELPGAGREQEALHRCLDRPTVPDPRWEAAVAALRAPQAQAEDSLRLVPALRDCPLPRPRCYHGPLRPDAVWEVLRRRTARERRRLSLVLGKLERDLEAQNRRGGREGPRAAGRRFTLAVGPAAAGRRDLQVRIACDGRAVRPPPQAAGLIASIVQDLGAVPEADLIGPGAGPYDAGADDGARTGAPGHPLFDDSGVHRYPEWDHARGRYRAGYCTLRELEVEPADEGFVRATLARHAGLVKTIRRTFEALVGDVRVVHRRREGEEVDLDALVEAQTDLRLGLEPSPCLYARLERRSRDVAVMLMVDMSGSTRGWVNDAEREALVLLCEALERLGDRYAIYGFSGRTHKRCEVYRVKRFDEPYDAAVRRRLSGIRPKSYTRIGAAIRHLGGMLAQVPARTRVLVTLSDGKPEDYRSYRGAYGIEDTRRALLELRAVGVHPYCITIDREGGDYLPHMYGPAGYAVIDDVARLPLKIADIYRRLTTWS